MKLNSPFLRRLATFQTQLLYFSKAQMSLTQHGTIYSRVNLSISYQNAKHC